MAVYEFNGQEYKSKRALNNAKVMHNLSEEGIRLSKNVAKEAFDKLQERYPDRTDNQLVAAIYLGFKNSIDGKLHDSINMALSTIPNKGRVYLVAFNFVQGGAVVQQSSDVVKIKDIAKNVEGLFLSKVIDESVNDAETNNSVTGEARNIISADIGSVDKM